MFGKEAQDEIMRIKSAYPTPRSAVLPALYIAQREFGWLSQDALQAVALALDMPKALVRGVATFHDMLKNAPSGKYTVRLCTNIVCMSHGSDSILDALQKLGLKAGSTSEDGRFTLQLSECLGACDNAPSMIINGTRHSGLKIDSLKSILDSYT